MLPGPSVLCEGYGCARLELMMIFTDSSLEHIVIHNINTPYHPLSTLHESRAHQLPFSTDSNLEARASGRLRSLQCP